ncbi:MAG: sugar transferase [Actinomycetia bacterium]|nr:sugar transferase [Actinomycetes bacterium]MCP5035748.1 sugar transferase [Actinomycetes bacterium]
MAGAYRELVSRHDVLTADRFRVVAAAALLVVVGRALAYAAIGLARKGGLGPRRVVVLAEDETRQLVARVVESIPRSGLTIDPDPDPDLDRRFEVLIADAGEAGRAAVPDLLRRCELAGADLYLLLAPELAADRGGMSIDRLGWLPLLPVRGLATRSAVRSLKRLVDVALGGVLLILAAPVIAACALVIRIQTGPGVLFRQERVGVNGRRFTIFKLRTIVPPGHKASETSWYGGQEPATGFARFLRVSSLDELPQLWNVVRGEMSLVGPRPERPFFVEQFSATVPDYSERHRVPAGMTGLAQIHGLRGDTSISDRARLDNAYIDSWSFSDDLKILARTMTSVTSRRGRGA